MNTKTSLLILGDSLLKGVFYDDTIQRHRVDPSGCLTKLYASYGSRIHNASRFGLTTTAAMPRLLRLLDEYPDAKTVLIELGGNDCDYDWPAIALDPQGTHFCHTPLQGYCLNLEKMVRLCQERGRTPVLATLPPIDAERFFLWVAKTPSDQAAIMVWLHEREIIERHQAQYDEAIRTVAARLECPLLDLRTPLLALPHWRTLLCSDGIHLREEGQAVVCAEVQSFLQHHHALGGTPTCQSPTAFSPTPRPI